MQIKSIVYTSPSIGIQYARLFKPFRNVRLRYNTDPFSDSQKRMSLRTRTLEGPLCLEARC